MNKRRLARREKRVRAAREAWNTAYRATASATVEDREAFADHWVASRQYRNRDDMADSWLVIQTAFDAWKDKHLLSTRLRVHADALGPVSYWRP